MDERRSKVLIVDDEVTLARAIERCLAVDHDVVVFDRAKDALARIEGGEYFDVILADVVMPEMTGIALYQRLLTIAPDQAARVVFLTGGAFTTGADDFLDTVPNQIIEKPFDPKGLREVIAEFAPHATPPAVR